MQGPLVRGHGEGAGFEARRWLKLGVVVALGIAVATFPLDTWRLVATIPGGAAAIALAGGLSGRPTKSVVPWLLTATALTAYGFAPLVGTLAPLAHALALMAVAAAIVTGSLQRWWKSIHEEAALQSQRHVDKTAWGAAVISLAVLVSVLALRVGAA